ncbi:virulence factor Mce family protein [Patulibacter medicamentivorans]|uniref:Virulence factor Mce family protein n=1 Tax=Patulibacter medicamentivorans TaxID=1097667 RepID=H0E6M5_9ACTN|nr:MlaD family protein [Patulibacter medicamentivorans]EHN10672.1 virulence factor Mce family protein [Patulibacter medicamentivorans]
MSGVRERMSDRLTRDRLRLEAARAFRPLLVVVAALLLGIAAIALLLVRLQVALPGQDRYEIRIAVADAKGVVAGSNEVRISGVVVGKVSKVQLDGRRAVLTARIQPRFAPLYRDARVRLRPKTPLEDMYLNVEDRGSPRAGKLQDGGLLAAGRTRTPVQIGAVLDVFDADVRPRVAQAIDGLGRGLDEHGDDFRAALGELAPFLEAARRLTRETAIRDRQTRRLVSNFAALGEELADRGDQVDALVRHGSSVLGELAASDRPLAALIEELPPTLLRLPRSFAIVRAAADDVDAAIHALRPTARALPGGLRAVERLSPDLRTAAVALRRPLPQLSALARALPRLTSDVADGIARLRPQAPRLDRVTKAIVPCELAVSKFFQWTVSVGKFYGVRGAVLRGDPIVGTNTLAGLIPDLGLTSKPDCAAGGPRK